MKLSVFKYPFVAIHAVLTLLLGYFSVNLYFSEFPLLIKADSPELRVLLITTLIHLLVSLIGGLSLLRLPEDSRNEVDRFLLPLFYISLSLSNIYVFAYSSKSFLPFSIIGKTTLFSLTFAFFILLLFGLFHIGINKGKLFHYTIVSFLGSLFISNIVPVSIALNLADRQLWYPTLPTFLFLGTLTLLALISFVELYLRDRSRHNLTRLLSLATVAIGSFLYIIRPNNFFLWASIVVFSFGVALSIPRTSYTSLN